MYMMCVPDTQNTLLDATDLRVKKILVDPGKKSSQPHKTQKRKCSLSINVYDRLDFESTEVTEIY